MPIAETDRTKGTIAEGLDGGKGTYRGCRGEKGWSMWEEEWDRVGGDGWTALCVSALSGNLDCHEIPQTDLHPAEPQKLRLRARMLPDLRQLAVLW